MIPDTELYTQTKKLTKLDSYMHPKRDENFTHAGLRVRL